MTTTDGATGRPARWHERTVALIHNDGHAEEVVELGDVTTDETVAYATTPEHATTILRAVNRLDAFEALVGALEHFAEWHANHFDDFDNDTNAQLLCLGNEVEAALRQARGEGA